MLTDPFVPPRRHAGSARCTSASPPAPETRASTPVNYWFVRVPVVEQIRDDEASQLSCGVDVTGPWPLRTREGGLFRSPIRHRRSPR
eukprot:7129831-Pyramimonas_sp.AAC.1